MSEKESWVAKKGSSGKRKRAGQGSHGSVTKAGKMRMMEPKEWTFYQRKTKHNLPKKNLKKSKCPRVSNRRKFEKRFELGRKSGQNYVL